MNTTLRIIVGLALLAFCAPFILIGALYRCGFGAFNVGCDRMEKVLDWLAHSKH